MAVQRLQGQFLNRGFTLVELVAVILIAGIILVVSARFIGHSVEGYTAAGSRNQMASTGRAAIERMTRELQDALPHSLRVGAASPQGDQCLEFMPLIQATRYLDPGFDGNAGNTFQAVDFSPALTLAAPAQVLAAIYPIDTEALYGAANPGPIAAVDAVQDTGGGDGKVTLLLDTVHSFTRRSPQQRLFLTRQPVSFCIDGDKLYRYRDYGLHETQCTPATCLPASAPGRSLLADGLDNAGRTGFRLEPSTLQRNAMVSITLNIRQRGENILLVHELMVRNVP